MTSCSRVSTGWKSLDGVIDHLRKGDNVVWQVDDIGDYQDLVTPFVHSALQRDERVVYIRFARHAALLEEQENVSVYYLDTENGFESFSAEVHRIIARKGGDACYVFDLLSDLLQAWATDLMIGDFFFVTCPYLFELNTIAYFAIRRHRHSFKAIARIRETTQVLIDVYNDDGRVCIHPIKAKHRYSPTMFFPHTVENNELVPVINSVDAARMFSQLSRSDAVAARRHLDYWDRLFIDARNLLQSDAPSEEKADMVGQLSRLMLSRNKRMLALIRRYISLDDLLAIKDRMIGTGFIGGKAVGMLLSRNILMQDETFDWQEVLVPHDSFYIGSDVFYSYIVQNGWWKLFMAHKTANGYFSKAAELKNRMLHGRFAEEITEQFQLMLEYFGQSPIIVRSSSLLEDDYGNAFAGKYASFFCVNQGSPEKRYEAFQAAVRRIYASAMGKDALAYRRQRGLDQSDEQMAILVQRVSGAYRKHYFFPEIAGVGLSRNPFVWKKNMDAAAGMVRLVCGLGTRAVNRVENDYPRIVALDAPLAKPLAGSGEIRKFSQHWVDLLNLDENKMETRPLEELVQDEPMARWDLLGSRDMQAVAQMRQMGRPAGDYRVLTFDPFLTDTSFVGWMGDILKKLEAAYQNPVDIEFTANFNRAGALRINLLQCRPFQTVGDFDAAVMPAVAREDHAVIRIENNVMGGNILHPVARIIYVVPPAYAALFPRDKFSVARLIGKLNRTLAADGQRCALLIGPGRWGTQSPEMGVPVRFSEINNIAAIAEISYQVGDMIPDLSFGTHFFHDLVESGIFYMAIYPENAGTIFNEDWIFSLPNQLESLSPAAGRLADVVRVVDTSPYRLMLASDIAARKVICYSENGAGSR
ncbi:MAG: PEP/pyruvate-binding domain-containing protein [Thermodesulfobacteriota bacterium]